MTWANQGLSQERHFAAQLGIPGTTGTGTDEGTVTQDHPIVEVHRPGGESGVINSYLCFLPSSAHFCHEGRSNVW